MELRGSAQGGCDDVTGLSRLGRTFDTENLHFMRLIAQADRMQERPVSPGTARRSYCDLRGSAAPLDTGRGTAPGHASCAVASSCGRRSASASAPSTSGSSSAPQKLP